MKFRILAFIIICISGFNQRLFAQLQSDSTFIHKVKQGENLYRLSLKYGCSVQDLKIWNNLNNVDYIQNGQNLTIKKVIQPIKKESETSVAESPTAIKISNRNDTISIRDSTIKSLKSNKEKKDKSNKKIEPIEEQDLTFEGTKIIKGDEYESSGKTVLESYLSTYFAFYSDSVGIGKYQKFPTSAPTSEKFSINILMIKAKYNSTNLRGTFALHTGDIPASAWSLDFNFIQEANIGFKISKNIWMDAGFFRTHLGVESIQPRENITTSISTTTYYEPYFLSGAKLTSNLSNKLTIQMGIFNGFNTFVETNKNKTFSFSVVFDPNKHLSLIFNTLYCDESPDFQIRKQTRIYNNFYFTYKSKKWDFAGEFNYGLQQNSGQIDSSETAFVLSSLLVSRFHINKKISVYGRAEYYLDKNEILTGPVLNYKNEKVGLNLVGGTIGIEYKPIKNSYLRLEWRRLITLNSDQKIFYYKQVNHQYRDEIITSLGFWF